MSAPRQEKKVDRSDLTKRIAALSPTKLELLAQRVRHKGEAVSQTRILSHHPRPAHAPLSFAQERLWLFDQLTPGSPVYNIPLAVRIKGPLDPSALARSLNEIIKRHESLRTTIDVINGEPAQVVGPAFDLVMPVFDLRRLDGPERVGRMRELMAEDARRPFDLRRGPLLRGMLIDLAEEDQAVQLTMHHIVSDAWSMAILVREIVAVYQASIENRPSPLEDLSIQYADYAEWQRKWLSGKLLQEQLLYWKKRLADAPAALELPTDQPRSGSSSFDGAAYHFSLPAELSSAIKDLSQQENVTLFMMLLAAFQILLNRHTGQDDIVVGSNVANRNRAEIEGLIGFFVNNILIRTDLSGEPAFRELIGRVRDESLGAFAHQEAPLEMLTNGAKSSSPLFQVMFVFQNAPVERLDVAGLTITPMETMNNTSKFDLTLFMGETEKGLAGSIEYKTRLFEETTIRRMADHFQALLENIVADPNATITSLSLAGGTQKEEVASAFTDALGDY